MGTISTSLPSDGTTADASDYNTPINTIVNEINGNLDNNNIKSSAAIAGSKLASASVTNTQIDFGGSGNGIWWEEIARTTLTVAGDTITVSDIPARKYNMVIWKTLATGGTTNGIIRFNNDSAANYANRTSTDGAADGSSASGTSIFAGDTGTAAVPKYGVFHFENTTGEEKLVIGYIVSGGAAGAANVPSRREFTSKWANTTAQVSRIDMINAGTGDYAIGSELVVLGHD